MSEREFPVSKMPLQTRMRFAFSSFLILLFLYTTYSAWGFLTLSRHLPLVVSVVALLAMVVVLVTDIAAYRRSGIVAADDVAVTSALAGSEVKEIVLDQQAERGEEVTASDLGLAEFEDPRLGAVEDPREVLKRVATVVAWILGYIVAIAIVGVMVASTAYLIGYLRLEAKTGWKIPLIGTTAMLVLMNVMRELLNLQWPAYVLRDVFDSLF